MTSSRPRSTRPTTTAFPRVALVPGTYQDYLKAVDEGVWGRKPSRDSGARSEREPTLRPRVRLTIANPARADLSRAGILAQYRDVVRDGTEVDDGLAVDHPGLRLRRRSRRCGLHRHVTTVDCPTSPHPTAGRVGRCRRFPMRNWMRC